MCRSSHLITTFGNAGRRSGDAILFISISAALMNMVLVLSVLDRRYSGVYGEACGNHTGGQKCLQSFD
jgi:hypothetical protein